LQRALARSAALHPAGFGVLDSAALGSLDPEMRERVLARMAAVIGGAHYPPRRERVAHLRIGLDSDPERARTLGGCRFVPWRGRLLVLRELAAAEPPVRVEPGQRRVWDRRFLAQLPAAAEGALMLGHLASFGLAGPELRARLATAGLPPLLGPVLPAFGDERGVAAVPAVGYVRPDGRVLPSLVFRPANPLATASFTVV
jgi:tRNA(Ile)-lysidine synthase